MKTLQQFKDALKAILDKQEKQDDLVNKALCMEDLLQKAGKPAAVGEVRPWKNGFKYKKMADGKWRRVYEQNERNKSMDNAAKRIMREIDRATSGRELMNIVLLHKGRFSDAAGVPHPIIEELRAYIDARDDEIAGGNTQARNRKQVLASRKKVRGINTKMEEVKDIKELSIDVDTNNKSIDELRVTTVGKLSKCRGVDITHKESGTVVQLGSHGIKKLVSDAAINKTVANGFTEAEHFALASNVMQIFEESSFAGSKADERSNNGNVDIERYEMGNIKLSSGKIAKAKITVKWSRNIDSRRIYSIEGVEFESVKKSAPGLGTGASRVVSGAPNASPDHDSIIPQSSKVSSAKQENSQEKDEGKVGDGLERDKLDDVLDGVHVDSFALDILDEVHKDHKAIQEKIANLTEQRTKLKGEIEKETKRISAERVKQDDMLKKLADKLVADSPIKGTRDKRGCTKVDALREKYANIEKPTLEDIEKFAKEHGRLAEEKLAFAMSKGWQAANYEYGMCIPKGPTTTDASNIDKGGYKNAERYGYSPFPSNMRDVLNYMAGTINDTKREKAEQLYKMCFEKAPHEEYSKLGINTEKIEGMHKKDKELQDKLEKLGRANNEYSDIDKKGKSGIFVPTHTFKQRQVELTGLTEFEGKVASAADVMIALAKRGMLGTGSGYRGVYIKGDAIKGYTKDELEGMINKWRDCKPFAQKVISHFSKDAPATKSLPTCATLRKSLRILQARGAGKWGELTTVQKLRMLQLRLRA